MCLCGPRIDFYYRDVLISVGCLFLTSVRIRSFDLCAESQTSLFVQQIISDNYHQIWTIFICKTLDSLHTSRCVRVSTPLNPSIVLKCEWDELTTHNRVGAIGFQCLIWLYFQSLSVRTFSNCKFSIHVLPFNLNGFYQRII